MPSGNFYAVRDDIADILRYALDELALELSEMHSAPNHALRRFASADEAVETLDLGVDPWGRGESTHLGLCAPRLGPAYAERFQLDVEGKPFREELVGWGVIHLSLGGVHGHAITPSRYAVNSEKRAQSREHAYAERLGRADAWDWAEVAAVVGKLRYHLTRRLAAGKTNADGIHYVLSRAHDLASAGYTLTDLAREPVPYP